MDYLCLAAGKGTRFGRLGCYLQKCMYPIGLRPFLEYSLLNLIRAPFVNPATDRLLLVVGHYHEQLRAYFGDEYEGLPIHYILQNEPLGTGHALFMAQQAVSLSPTVIVWLADLYVSADLFAQIHAHPATNVQTLAIGHPDEPPQIRVEVAGERVVRAWEGRSAWCDMGLWKISAELLAGMTRRQTGEEYRVLPNIQHAIEDGAEVGYLLSEAWVHLGGTFPTVEENVAEVIGRLWQR